ncbi:uncharacterized protein LOC128961912 [Oppia nitens]|uniref:uncharacterized protein LOC128961912 n=1 Tax=Oppia nitens TaxID=1686743 RepID=UPI0023DCBAAF|nr:uncharacterized protein LOC128961912 [Oppia nitens]
MSAQVNGREDNQNLFQFEQRPAIAAAVVDTNLVTLMNAQTMANNGGGDHPLPQSSISSPPPYSTVPGTVPLYMSRTAGPPPSYDDVINPEAPPPSYQSLFGQVREARKSANGVLDFLRKLMLIVIGTLGCTMIIGFTLVIPLSMIIVGTIYMNDCRIENIPEFLFIGGMVWIFKNLMNVWSQCKRSSIETEAEAALRYKRHESLLNCFLFGWFVAGCVIVYRSYLPDFEDKNSARYCNRSAYLFAFWLVTSTFILFATFMTCLCGLTMSAIFANTNADNEPQINDNA